MLISIGLIIYFDPFRSAFDKIFVQQDYEPLGSIEFNYIWTDETEGKTLDKASIPVKMIERYFECIYTAFGEKDADCGSALSSLYGSGCAEIPYDLAAISSCSQRLKVTKIDLSAKSAALHLFVESVVPIGNEGTIISLRQSTEVVFNSLKGIVSSDGIYTHTFVIEHKGGNYYISSHECSEGMWKYSKNALNSLCNSDNPSYELLSEQLKVFRKILPSKISEISALISAKGYDKFSEPQTEYNREGAAEYALKWTSPVFEMRNTERWKDYEDDSVNFVSQCIYAGLGKMDSRGSYVWKWFDPMVDLESPNSGCSNTWLKAENFWIYCSVNGGNGISCSTGAGGGQLEKGDVIQLMFNDKAVSEVIVTDVVKDVKGNKLDFLVTGHDSDFVNYPLSLVHCDGMRFIKILGFNEQQM